MRANVHVTAISIAPIVFEVIFLFIASADCNATEERDASDVGVRLASHLTFALRFHLSQNQLNKWNASLTETGMTCVENQVKEQLMNPKGGQCVITVKNDAVLGSGMDYEDDSEIPSEELSKAFCNDGCHNIFISAYKDCGFIADDVSRKLFGGLCTNTNEKDMQCIEILTRFDNDTQLRHCMSASNCEGMCKQIIAPLRCCLRTEEAEVAKLLTNCGLTQESKWCKETAVTFITNTAFTNYGSVINSILLSAIFFVGIYY